MGVTYESLPLEIVKYIKIPDRRLISGLLTINIVNHYDNESYDDAQEYYYDKWDSGLDADIKNATPFFAVKPDDPGRTDYKHTFGDYDCLLFYVTGGMTLNTPSFSDPMTESALVTGGYLNAITNKWTDDSTDFDSEVNWYDTLFHPCQHFLKYHLISRINNGYGHTSTNYYKINPIQTNSFELDGNEFPEDLKKDDTGTPYGYSDGSGGEYPDETKRGGKWSRHIISNGVFSNDSDGDFITDLSVDTNNTYFPQIQGVEIYGKHNFSIPTHGNGSGGNVYSNSGMTHEDEYWSMVIKMKVRGYDSTSPDAEQSQADKEFFKNRTNIFFQPFGETANFDISDNFHT